MFNRISGLNSFIPSVMLLLIMGCFIIGCGQAPSTSQGITPAATSKTAPPSPSQISLPALKCVPDEMHFHAMQGETGPQEQGLGISASNGEPVDWSISDDATWLEIKPASGRGRDTVTVSVNFAGMPSGIHKATISISSPQTGINQISVPVKLTVKTKLAISDTILVRNTGSVTLRGTIKNEGDGIADCFIVTFKGYNSTRTQVYTFEAQKKVTIEPGKTWFLEHKVDLYINGKLYLDTSKIQSYDASVEHCR